MEICFPCLFVFMLLSTLVQLYHSVSWVNYQFFWPNYPDRHNASTHNLECQGFKAITTIFKDSGASKPFYSCIWWNKYRFRQHKCAFVGSDPMRTIIYKLVHLTDSYISDGDYIYLQSVNLWYHLNNSLQKLTVLQLYIISFVLTI